MRIGRQSRFWSKVVSRMTIWRIGALTGLPQVKFCEKYHIPLNTFARWEQGKREPPDYLVELLEFKVREDLKKRGSVI